MFDTKPEAPEFLWEQLKDFSHPPIRIETGGLYNYDASNSAVSVVQQEFDPTAMRIGPDPGFLTQTGAVSPNGRFAVLRSGHACLYDTEHKTKRDLSALMSVMRWWPYGRIVFKFSPFSQQLLYGAQASSYQHDFIFDNLATRCNVRKIAIEHKSSVGAGDLLGIEMSYSADLILEQRANGFWLYGLKREKAGSA